MLHVDVCSPFDPGTPEALSLGGAIFSLFRRSLAELPMLEFVDWGSGRNGADTLEDDVAAGDGPLVPFCRGTGGLSFINELIFAHYWYCVTMWSIVRTRLLGLITCHFSVQGAKKYND